MPKSSETKPAPQKVYLVMATCFDYDDEHFTGSDGGFPVQAYPYQRNAETRAQELNIATVQNDIDALGAYIHDGPEPEQIKALESLFGGEDGLEWSEFCPRGITDAQAARLLTILPELRHYYVSSVTY